MEIIGKPISRRDSHLQTSGRAIYGDDQSVSDMLHVKILRSKYSHARILHVDTNDAKKSPGVVAVITAKDVPNNRWGFSHIEQPVLCDNKVCYRGDAIAAVAATSVEAAEIAIAKINVEYRPLDAVLDLETALNEKAPKIHGDSNIASTIKIRRGNIDQGWRNSEEIIEETYKTQRVQHCHLEPHVARAELSKNGKLIVHSSLQRVFRIAQDLSHILEIPRDQILVKSLCVGGAFGAKTEISIEPIVCIFALKTGLPVKMVLTREEEFKATVIRHPFILKYKTGVRKNGEIIARKVELIVDTGAYVSQGQSVLAKAAINCCGPYFIPNVEIDGYLVYTNTNIGSAMRGFGVNQVAFAYESHTDVIAEAIGMDPVRFRQINILRNESLLPTGQVITNPTGLNTLKQACFLSDWKMENLD